MFNSRNSSGKIIATLLSLALVVIGVPCTVFAQQSEFRGIWVTTVYSKDYPASGYTTDATLLKNEAVKILDNVKDMGFNAVFLQVRPSADAFYKSNLFPWSKYLTGTQGVAPENDFDPLAFFVEEAHKRGLELHAWLNPYRVTASKTDNGLLAANNPAVRYPELTVIHTDGKVYFNPGEPAARQLIIDGIKEIIDNYEVDGIHLDDYFYPGADFNDSYTYAKYGEGFSNREDWRRNNNDLLIRGIYDTIHEKGAGLRFGVSPAGIWANKASNPLGSDTRGNQTYYALYADTRGWVKKGYVDYILPQIYWNIGYSAADYEKLVNWWSDVVEGTGVKLYIGQAAYKAGDSQPSSPWYGVSEIERQLNLNRNTQNVSGYSMFTYDSCIGNQPMNDLLKQLNRTADVPSAKDVSFTGEAVEGQKLTAAYTYFDPLGRYEKDTAFEWYIADKGSHNYEIIPGEKSRTLLVKKEYTGKKIRVKVIPKNGEAQGIGVFGENGRNTVIARGDVTKDGVVDYKDALHLLQYTAGKVSLDSQAQAAADCDGRNGIGAGDVRTILGLLAWN